MSEQDGKAFNEAAHDNQNESFDELSSSEIGLGLGDAREVLAKYIHCHECGSLLHFSHLTDFSRNLTQETATCPECGNRARRVTHKLQ